MRRWRQDAGQGRFEQLNLGGEHEFDVFVRLALLWESTAGHLQHRQDVLSRLGNVAFDFRRREDARHRLLVIDAVGTFDDAGARIVGLLGGYFTGSPLDGP